MKRPRFAENPPTQPDPNRTYQVIEWRGVVSLLEEIGPHSIILLGVDDRDALRYRRQIQVGEPEELNFYILDQEDWWSHIAKRFFLVNRPRCRMRWDLLPEFFEQWGEDAYGQFFLMACPDMQGDAFLPFPEGTLDRMRLFGNDWLQRLTREAKQADIRTWAELLIEERRVAAAAA